MDILEQLGAPPVKDGTLWITKENKQASLCETLDKICDVMEGGLIPHEE